MATMPDLPTMPSEMAAEFVEYRVPAGTNITVQEAAAILGVENAHVLRLLRRGSITGLRQRTAGWIVSRSSVEDYARRQQS